ncbi:MAG: hypothetical protein M1818_003278 [Claussenomyces sp. TS43310]|nr:MAG: hypothetical protein M1818_003278 [Claussenomyces sp. TS43310]
MEPGMPTAAGAETLPHPHQVPTGTSSRVTVKPLSCVSCRQRKIKCNKVHPCAPCLKSGMQCVFPNRVRVPRGRQGATKARDSELLKRIARLESLVSKVDASKALKQDDEVGESRGSGSNVPPTTVDSVAEPRPREIASQYAAFVRRQENGTQYISNDFWTNLGEEMDGLRQLLESPSETESDSDNSVSMSTASKPGSDPSFIFGIPDSSDERPDPPSDVHRAILYQYYFSNVHPVYMILHKPVFVNNTSNAVELGLMDPESKRFRFASLEAIVGAVSFASVSSMSPEDCLQEFNEEKSSLQSKFKRATERALVDADFLNSMEITTLQAFAIYVLALRSYSASRSSWALISLVVRIAQSLGLHKDGDGFQYSPFEGEMRRRLWWHILLQDIRASEDRGSEPVILENSFNTRMPRNLNDDDFGLESVHSLPNKKGFTDMTFSLITMHVSNTSRYLHFIPPTNSQHVPTLQQKEVKVRECSQLFESQFFDGLEPTSPVTWASIMVGRLLILRLWTVVQYPLQSRPATPRHELPRGQGLRIITAYLELIEVIGSNPTGKPFTWLFDTYVPWHPVAIALAELINNPKGALADKAWAVISRNYKRWAELVADSKEGMLWRPVKKLYKRAQAARHRDTDLESRIANAELLVDSTQEILPEMPTFHPGNTINNYSYSVADPVPLLNPIEQNALSNLEFDWSQAVPMSLQFGVQPELYGGSVNWDDWNQFIFDVGEVGSLSQPMVLGQWPMQM